MINLRKKGLASTVDIIFFTLMVALACLQLISSSSMKHKIYNSQHAERAAQTSLLIFQEVPVKKFSSFSYTPNLRLQTISPRKIREKTISKLITEDVLLNPKWIIDNTVQKFSVNRKFSEKLEMVLKKSLDKLVGKRYNYKLSVQLNPIKISEEKTIQYQKVIKNFGSGSEKICSESINLNFSIPSTWLEKTPSNFQSSRTLSEKSKHISDSFFPVEKRKNNTENPSSQTNDFSSIIVLLELWTK